jgi:hypothetical protein
LAVHRTISSSFLRGTRVLLELAGALEGAAQNWIVRITRISVVATNIFITILAAHHRGDEPLAILRAFLGEGQAVLAALDIATILLIAKTLETGNTSR